MNSQNGHGDPTVDTASMIARTNAEAKSTHTHDGNQLALPLQEGIEVMSGEDTQPMSDHEHHEFSLPAIDVDAPIGMRLAVARQARNWTHADVGARLKLPVKLIERLERGDYEGLTQGVFLRGYLGSYARLVGVPAEDAASAAAEHTESPPLVATGTVSRSRYMFDRYSVSATYLVLTAIIVVPAVWLATHGGLEQNLARTTPLDPPAATTPSRDDTSSVATSDTHATDVHQTSGDNQRVGDTAATTPSETVPVTHEQSPVVASMTPFVANPTVPNAAATKAEDAAASVTPSVNEAAIARESSGAHTVQLKLSQQSWVEMTTVDGRKLEYGILAAGSEHQYASDGPVTLRIGNAQGAQVRTDGAAVDLTPYQRGNVARLTLFGDSKAKPDRADAPATQD